MTSGADTIRSGEECRLASSAAHSTASSDSSEPSTPTMTGLVAMTEPPPQRASARMAGRGDQPDPGRLQSLGDHARQPPGELVTERRIGLAAGPYRPPVELEGLDRARGHGAEGPPVRREQPRPAEHLAHADGVDLHPALPGHVQVERHVAGLDQPEPVGAAAVLEEPVPGRERDVRGGLREHGQVIAGHAVQERVSGQGIRRYFDHGYHRLAIRPRSPACSCRSGRSQGRKSLAARTMARPGRGGRTSRPDVPEGTARRASPLLRVDDVRGRGPPDTLKQPRR